MFQRVGAMPEKTLILDPVRWNSLSDRVHKRALWGPLARREGWCGATAEHLRWNKQPKRDHGDRLSSSLHELLAEDLPGLLFLLLCLHWVASFPSPDKELRAIPGGRGLGDCMEALQGAMILGAWKRDPGGVGEAPVRPAPQFPAKSTRKGQREHPTKGFPQTPFAIQPKYNLSKHPDRLKRHPLGQRAPCPLSLGSPCPKIGQAT